MSIFQYFRSFSPILEEIQAETHDIYARQCSFSQSEKHNKLLLKEKDSSVNLAASIPRYISHRECLGIIDDKCSKEATTTEIPSRVKKFPNRRMGELSVQQINRLIEILPSKDSRKSKG